MMAIPFIGRVRFFSSRKAPADIPMAPPIELIIEKGKIPLIPVIIKFISDANK